MMRQNLFEYCIEHGHQKLLEQWHPEKNGDLTPRDISYGSKKKIWWLCKFGHEWDAAVYARTGQGNGCPYCAGKKLLSSSRTLATAHPDLVKEWHPTKNHGLFPGDVLPGSYRRVWWICKKGHEWQARINARSSGTGCPVCSNRKVKTGENDLATTHPEIADQWDYEKNGALTPQKVVAGNISKVWWRCERGHEWKARIDSRTNGNNGCPFCAGKQVIPGENDLASMFPQIAAQWHLTKNGTLTPENVTSFSNRRVWWKCELGHEWQAMITHRTAMRSGCPYCAGRTVLPGFNDLQTKHPKIAAEWHPSLNGSLTPEMVTPGSTKKVWWQCGEGHVWKAVVYSRTSTSNHGCPVCAGKVKQAKKRYYDELERDLKMQKLDDSIRQALLDAIKLDLENQDSASHEFAPPSAHHQQEMAEMLKDPNAWAAKHK